MFCNLISSLASQFHFISLFVSLCAITRCLSSACFCHTCTLLHLAQLQPLFQLALAHISCQRFLSNQSSNVFFPMPPSPPRAFQCSLVPSWSFCKFCCHDNFLFCENYVYFFGFLVSFLRSGSKPKTATKSFCQVCIHSFGCLNHWVQLDLINWLSDSNMFKTDIFFCFLINAHVDVMIMWLLAICIINNYDSDPPVWIVSLVWHADICATIYILTIHMCYEIRKQLFHMFYCPHRHVSTLVAT